MANLSLLVILGLAVTAFGQEKDAACRSLVKCLSDAEDAKTQCDKQRSAAVNQNRKPNSDECSTINQKQEDLQNLLSQQRKQHRDCLTNSFADATPVGDKNKQELCRKAVSDYQAQPTAAKIAVNANVQGNVRSRRQVSGGAATHTNASVGVGSSSNNGHPSRAGPSPAANGPGTGANGSASSSSGNGPQSNVGPAAARGNGTSAGNAAAANLKECYQNAEIKQKACRELASCCSEMTPCEFKYQLSPLHNQIYQAQLDLFNLRRRCQQQRLQKGKPGPATNANATVVASVKGGSGKKPTVNQ